MADASEVPARWIRIAQWFVPADLVARGGEHLRKAHLVVWSCLLFSSLTLGPMIGVLAAGETKIQALFMGMVVFTALLLPFALRSGTPLHRLTIWLTIVPLLAMFGGAYSAGGIHASPAQAMLLVPVYSFFLGGMRRGLFALIAATLAHLALAIQAAGQPEAVPRAIGLIVLDGFLFLLVLGFHNIARRAYLALDTRNRQLEESNRQLSEARDATEAALADRTRLLATMSHEVRTPMSGIVGLARMLKERELDAGTRDDVKLLLGASEALLAIVDDVLDLAKMEAGSVDLARVDFQLEALLSDAVSLMRGSSSGTAVKVGYTIDERLPPWLCGDHGRMRQVLLNLMSNALRFTDRGHVRVRALMSEPADADQSALGVRFEVEDTGVGLTEEERARVFDAFAQVHHGNDRGHGPRESYTGTGLGLTICKELVMLMGGHIGVESEPGRGSTFWFELAIEPGREPEPSGVHPLPRRMVTNNDLGPRAVRVLVVEDNPINRRVAENLLRSLGCEVDAVGTGRDAIAVIFERDGHHDLVLMDRHLPDMDGVQATVEIRRREREREPHGRRIRIVAHSAIDGAEERKSCLQAGMDGYLHKPVSSADMAATLREHTHWAHWAHRAHPVADDGESSAQ